MQFKIYFKEKLYLTIMLIVSFLAYVSISLLIFSVPIILYFSIYLIVLFLLNIFGRVLFIGHLRGNAIKVQQKQFPEIFEILKKQSEKLGLKNIPTLYLLQGHGLLNAFATKFTGTNYVILYSNVLEAAYQEGLPAVEFIIGHELGHVKRSHIGFLKKIFLLPAQFVPFLNTAYKRACEYTCDNIAYNLCPDGAEKGLLILAAGKNLHKKVNISELILSAQLDDGFATWFAEIFSTHPHLVKRIEVINILNQNNPITRVSPFVVESKWAPSENQIG